MRALMLASLLTLGSCALAFADCIGPAAPHLARLAASGILRQPQPKECNDG